MSSMKPSDPLVRYLEEIAGETAVLRPVLSARLRGLPAFLAAAYSLRTWAWLGQKVVLAQSTDDAASPSPSDVRSHLDVLQRQLGEPMVAVLPAASSHQRDRLIKLRVPFIVPGRQLFIPPFVSLTEQFHKTIPPGRLSAAAQVCVLYQLLRHPPAGTPLSQWAKWLGYSAMTLTKVRGELSANGLCDVEDGVKVRGLCFSLAGRSLWDAARPLLRSPVQRVVWVKTTKPLGNALVAAGLTALDRLTMLADDPLPTYACRATTWSWLLHAQKVSPLEEEDGAAARIELWRYAPGILAERGTVDPLSLCLSVADSSDERVQQAAAQVLETIQW